MRLFTELGLSEAPGTTSFNDKNVVLLPGMPNATEHAPNHHIFNQFVIRVQYRNALRAYLSEKGIGTEVYYPIPFHEQPCFLEIPTSKLSFPVSDCAAKDVLALPIFPELTQEQIIYVASTIAEFFANPENLTKKECLDCDCGKKAKRL
jgi:dTDP-4-amino-4,6-dideoxygalactose transaminase